MDISDAILSASNRPELFVLVPPLLNGHIIVSTGCVRYAAAAARREIFGVNALRGKQQQLGSPNLQDIFIGG